MFSSKIVFAFLIFFITFNCYSESRWYSLNFTNPGNEENDRTVLEYFCNVIRSSKTAIDAAFFKIDSPDVINALSVQAAKGVRVRVVTDDGQTAPEIIAHLKKHGVSVESDGRSSFMHNKFMIIDSSYVWTGSLNVTNNGFFKNNNNSVLIKSGALA